MPRRLFAAVAAAALLLLSIPVPMAQAADEARLPREAASYTALTSLDFGGERVEMTTYHDRGRERHEIDFGDFEQIVILRPDRGRAYVLLPEGKTVHEVPFEEATPVPLLSRLVRHKVELDGTAKVSGEEARLYRLTTPEGVKEQLALSLWITDDGILVRLEGQIAVEGAMAPIAMIRSEIKRGAVDPARFELPAGWKRTVSQ
ncbi:MAG: hypothetical protein ACREGK_06015 [Geminicoccales bacterium]